MNQFGHIRLRDHKGLKRTDLTDLAKINVLCGPNGGGKTTALECVADEKLHSSGISFQAAQIDALEKTVDGTWNNPVYASCFRGALEDVFTRDRIYFHEDGPKLWKDVNAAFNRRASQKYNLTFEHNFGLVFRGQFSTPPSRVLIPAKRGLKSVTTVSTEEKIEPNGSGILNFLFLSKNRDALSPLRKKFDSISAAFEKISNGCNFDVHLRTQNNEIELMFCMANGHWLPAEACGLGFRDLLIILYFSLASEEDVIAIEEPENHLHPEMQRQLFCYLKISTSKQFFLSTHSSIFLSTQYADRVFSCRLQETVKIENATSRAQLLTELGYSIADNIVSDLVVLCEGPKDKLVLEEFFRKLGYASRFRIKIWPLGGDIMDQLDLEHFAENHRVTALIDGDPSSAKVRKRFIANCEAKNLPVHQLERYALENYFPLAAIKSAMPNPIPEGLKELDPKRKVSDQLGFEVKKNSLSIAQKMSLEDITGSDFEAFLLTVGQLLESNAAKSEQG